MECAVITTYRCNAKCGMCNTWQNPSNPFKEFKPEILKKLPHGMKRLNITGGEPFLRNDIEDIVGILSKKSNRLEISTNGYFYQRIEKICKEFPSLTIRVSIEGLPKLNDDLRGIKNGFDRALRAILRLNAMGVKDIGFAMTISGDNCYDLLDLYSLVSTMDIEFANAIVHNSFYFHKYDNSIDNAEKVEEQFIRYIKALLQSNRKSIKRRFKDWFRAYLNLGLLNHLKGNRRAIACGAGTDTFFVDPYGQMLACNGSKEPLVMGDLNHQSFSEIWNSRQADQMRSDVAQCDRNCWMTGTAVPAMRRRPWIPAFWVLKNKLNLALGRPLVLR